MAECDALGDLAFGPVSMLIWMAAYRRDIARYTAYSGGGRLVQLLTQQGLWALFQYRLAAALYQSACPGLLKRPLLVAAVVWQKGIEILTGISLPYTARIGAGLYIGHFGNIIVNGGAVIGEHCNLSQGVTIGVSGRGRQRGVPIVGQRVYIGANAVVAGKIRVADDVVIAANSLVNTDVPAQSVVMGVPAQVVSRQGSAAYINPRNAR